MKKLIGITLTIVFCFALSAQAATVSWTHDGQNTVGYTIYFWETDVPDKVYNKSVVGSTVRQLEIQDMYFKPGVQYSFEGKAYNNYATSEPSNRATWTRVVDTYAPPVDSMPTTVIIDRPSQIILNMGN
jgi:hypothetical protein